MSYLLNKYTIQLCEQLIFLSFFCMRSSRCHSVRPVSFSVLTSVFVSAAVQTFPCDKHLLFHVLYIHIRSVLTVCTNVYDVLYDVRAHVRQTHA